jgi:hypothetical protein
LRRGARAGLQRPCAASKVGIQADAEPSPRHCECPDGHPQFPRPTSTGHVQGARHARSTLRTTTDNIVLATVLTVAWLTALATSASAKVAPRTGVRSFGAGAGRSRGDLDHAIPDHRMPRGPGRGCGDPGGPDNPGSRARSANFGRSRLNGLDRLSSPHCRAPAGTPGKRYRIRAPGVHSGRSVTSGRLHSVSPPSGGPATRETMAT